MNSRGRINCPSESCPAGRFIPSSRRGLPLRLPDESGWRRPLWQQPGSPPFIALRTLVHSGLACVLARPPYDEAQTAIWAARWAKLPNAARSLFDRRRRAAAFFEV